MRPPRIRGLRTNQADADVAVAVQGDNLAQLQKLGIAMQQRLANIAGLEGVELSTEEASPQLSVEIDRQRAADLGLDVAQVGQTARTALDGTIVTRFTEGNNEYDVRVQLPNEAFTSPEDLGAIALFSGSDEPIYLRDVAGVRLGTGPTTILRVNQNRQLRVTGDVNKEIGTARLRPILMTTTTTVCGMLPLALGLGEGSELMQPLAVAVVGGLTVSTLLTLIVVPCAYLIINSTSQTLKRWVVGGQTPVNRPPAA